MEQAYRRDLRRAAACDYTAGRGRHRHHRRLGVARVHGRWPTTGEDAVVALRGLRLRRQRREGGQRGPRRRRRRPARRRDARAGRHARAATRSTRSRRSSASTPAHLIKTHDLRRPTTGRSSRVAGPRRPTRSTRSSSRTRSARAPAARRRGDGRAGHRRAPSASPARSASAPECAWSPIRRRCGMQQLAAAGANRDGPPPRRTSYRAATSSRSGVARPARWRATATPARGCGTPLAITRGIEVGHIFKLGTKYSEAMACNFPDESGQTTR